VAPKGVLVVALVTLVSLVAACGSGSSDADSLVLASRRETVASAPPPSVSASRPPAPGSLDPLRAGGRYVALGSSFASGPGIPVEVDAQCGRSTRNYANLVADRLGLALVDVTCGGATVDQVHDEPQWGRAPQLAALTPDTALVTVTVGGNDVAYIPAAVTCGVAAGQGRSCLGAEVDPSASEQAMTGLHDELTAMLRAVRVAAPRARVVLVGYLRIFGTGATPCPPELPSTAEAARYVATLGDRLRDVHAAAAASAGVEFVDAHARSVGRDACAGPDRRWMEGAVPVGAAPYHVNPAGMEGVADMVVDELRD
jgi:lysophospholipase L1-like esterase